MTEEQEKEECGEIRVNGWHLKKEVTIGQLVTIVAILISGLWWASSVETRLVHLNGENHRIEEKTKLIFNNMATRFDRYQNDVSKALAKIDRSINKLGDKIDHKADKE